MQGYVKRDSSSYYLKRLLGDYYFDEFKIVRAKMTPLISNSQRERFPVHLINLLSLRPLFVIISMDTSNALIFQFFRQ